MRLSSLYQKVRAAQHSPYIHRDRSRVCLDPTDIASIYVRLGSIYLQNATAGAGLIGSPEAEHKVDAKFARMAKSMYLRACERDPSSTSWLGAGKACIALGELDEAEDAFAVSLFTPLT